MILAKVFASEGHKVKVKTAFFAIKMEFLSACLIEGKSKETTYTHEKTVKISYNVMISRRVNPVRLLNIVVKIHAQKNKM